MKVLLTAIVLGYSLVSFAVEKKQADPLLTTTVTSEDFENLSIGSSSEIGLKVFLKNLGMKAAQNFEVHNILYTSTNLNKWVFVQANMAVADKAAGEITTLEDGKSFFSVKGKTNFFILTLGLQRDEVLKLQKIVSGNAKQFTLQPSGKTKFLSYADFVLGLKVAHAEESKCLSGTNIRKNLKANQEAETTVLRVAAGCVNGAGMGVWDATLGTLNFAYSVATKGSEQILCGAANTVNMAWKRCDEYAASMERSIDSTMKVVGDMKAYAGKAVDGFADLPGETQAYILCEMGNAAATGAAVTFATAGAGAPVALSRMSEVLKKASEMPSMSKSSGTLKAMAANMEKKSAEKTAALAEAKPMPSALEEALADVERYKKVVAKGAADLDKATKLRDVWYQDAKQYTSWQNLTTELDHSGSKIMLVFEAKELNPAEIRKTADFILKHAVLTSEEKALATKIVASKDTDIIKGSAIAATDAYKLSKVLRDKKFDYLKLRSSSKEDSLKLAQKLRDENVVWAKGIDDAQGLIKRASENLSQAQARYWNVLEKQKLTEKQRETYGGLVATYSPAVFCNAVRGSTGPSNSKATESSSGKK